MPTINVPIGADLATTQSGLAAGLGPHLPVGTWSGTRYRSAVRFTPPVGWQDWTSITSAKLVFWISDHAHLGPAGSDIYIRRMATGAPWLTASGTQNCNSGFSGSNASQWDDIIPTSTDQASFASGSTANAKKVVSVTAALRAYWTGNASRIVFVFDQITSSDYTEIWSGEVSGKEPYLEITYTTSAAPDPPALVAPAANASGLPRQPTFQWTHDATDGAQTGADVALIETTGPTVHTTQHVTGAGNTLVWPVPLDNTPGLIYDWKVRTSNSTGTGAYSASRLFTLASTPTLDIDTVRAMEFDNHAPRLRVNWAVTAFAVAEHRVTTGAGYDSGWLAGNPGTHLLAATLSDNVAVAVTVQVRDVVGGATGTTLSDSQSFTPRYGLSTHRTNLGSPPTVWVSAVPGVTAVPPAQVVLEYAANAGGATPAAGDWKTDLGDIPLAQYLWYRAWLIPSATAGCSLDSLIVTAQQAPPLDLDKWTTAKGSHAFAPPFAVDEGQYVYGSRSARVDVSSVSAGGLALYSEKITLKAGRSYVLTGLMKSEGNSGAHFRLESEAGAILDGATIQDPSTPLQMISTVLAATTKFYNEKADVNRYATPVLKVGASDIEVRVVLGAGRTGAVAPAVGWWDAVKLEESTVATPWSPGGVGAAVVDAGGVQVDGRRGGVFRVRGSNAANTRAVFGGGVNGLSFAGDTELSSPSVGALALNGIKIQHAIRRVNPSSPWTPPAGLAFVEVEVVGGGGASGGVQVTVAAQTGSSAGGAGGGYARKVIAAADLSGTYAITVGAGGTGVSGGAGNDGGTSSFVGTGHNVAATGGNGGQVGTAIAGSALSNSGAGGVGSGGDINCSGQAGGGGGVNASIRYSSGNGGSSVLGGGGAWGNLALGTAGGNYGGGGGGSSSAANTAAKTGLAGGPGVVILTEYY